MPLISLALLITLGLMALSFPRPDISMAQAEEGTIAASFSIIVPIATVDTTITPTPAELSDLEAALEPIVGVDLTLTFAPVEIISSVTPGSELTIPLPLTGAPEELFPGNINFVLDNLDVETTGGISTATVQFDPVLTVQAEVSLAGTDEAGLNLNLTDPQLIFTPSDPNAALLPGGDPLVTEIGASFDVELTELPDGSALDVTFAKDTSALLSDAVAKFSLIADSVDAEIGVLSSDVAFGVKVSKVGIGDQHLGDNLVTLEVSQDWFDAKIGEGKRILIAKFDDAGDPVVPPQDVTDSCTSAAEPVVCSATLSGSLGGLNTYFLAAMTLENSPPVVVAAFTAIEVLPGEGTFAIVATATDPDEDPLVINSFLVTPPLTGLEIELSTVPLAMVSFEIGSGNAEISGPDPEAILASLRDLGGFAVENGQTIQVEIVVGPDVTIQLQGGGSIKVEAAEITLSVTATDPLGQSSTAVSSPVFPAPIAPAAAQQIVENSTTATGVGSDAMFPSVNAQLAVSQSRTQVLPNQESRIQTPDGRAEIAIPEGFLESDQGSQSIQLVLKNLDPAKVPADSNGVTPIRTLEVNALVDGHDGSITVGEAATLVITLSTQDIEMAGGDSSSLTIHQLDPATGTWEPLTTVYRTGAEPPRLEATLQDFQHTAIGIFRDAPPASLERGLERNTPLQDESTPISNNPELSPAPTIRVPVIEEAGGWSSEAKIGVGFAAAILLVALATAVLLIFRTAHFKEGPT